MFMPKNIDNAAARLQGEIRDEILALAWGHNNFSRLSVIKKIDLFLGTTTELPDIGDLLYPFNMGSDLGVLIIIQDFYRKNISTVASNHLLSGAVWFGHFFSIEPISSDIEGIGIDFDDIG
ncbi:hypothetical protein ACJX0J_039264 [Zea mays]